METGCGIMRNPEQSEKMMERTQGRLLIVGDKRETVTPLCEFLSETGYDAVGFTSAEEALEELARHPFDLLLTELMIPGMDGLSLLKASLEVDPQLVGIIMAEQGTTQTAAEVMKAGAFDFVLKPVEFTMLMPVISRGMVVRRLQKELDAQREFSDAIFNNTPSGIMVLDREEHILKINNAGAEILQISPTVVLSVPLTAIYPESKGMLAFDTRFGREVVITLKDGKTTPIGFSNSPLLDKDGKEKGIIIVFRDITEIKELEKEVRKKQHFEAMGKVISGVAHEIRNPLFAIQSIAQILQRESESLQHQALISALLKETERMRKLVDELLLYSRPSTLTIIELDLELFLAEIKEFVRAKNYGTSLSVNVPPFTAFKADKDKIMQVFLNLMENAAGAGSKKIDITSEKEDNRLRIVIRDDGVGIKPDDMERIFDPFFTTKKEGTGLGLPICRKIIEDHGGSMEIESVVGQGTVAILTFRT